MSCTHAGMIYYDTDTEEWYCRRCGDTTDQPTGWTAEEVAADKGEEVSP